MLKGVLHYWGFTVVVVNCFLCLPWLCLVVCCLSTSDPFPVLSLLGLISVKCVFGVVGWWGEEGDSVAIHQSLHSACGHSLLGGCCVEWCEVCLLYSIWCGLLVLSLD